MNWLAYIQPAIGVLESYRSYSPLLITVVCAIGATNLSEQADSDALLAEGRNLSRVLLWPSDDNVTNRNLGDLVSNTHGALDVSHTIIHSGLASCWRPILVPNWLGH